MVPDDRWCGSPFPGGRGRERASERAGRQLPGALPRSLAPRSQKLPIQTHARRCPFSTTSSGSGGRTSGCPPPLQIGWNLLGPQECSTVSTHFTSSVFLLSLLPNSLQPSPTLFTPHHSPILSNKVPSAGLTRETQLCWSTGVGWEQQHSTSNRAGEG